MDLLLPLDRNAPQSLRDQLYDGLRAAILDGRAPAGSRLPATRVLAREMGISRLTVEDSFARLVSEGYISGRQGSGTYVLADILPSPTRPLTVGLDNSVPSPQVAPIRRWSSWGNRAAAVAAPMTAVEPVAYDFRQGMPALDAFPISSWTRIRARESRQITPERYHYGPSAGDESLRVALGSYLARSRGLRRNPEDIVVTSGAQQGLDLLVRLLIEPGDRVAIEDPGYPAARRIFLAAGATLVPIPVDRDGMVVEHLERKTPDDGPIRMVYVTPSHQYPTGGVMSLDRRLALLAWARSSGAIILEDDYDAEFRYGVRPVESLTGLDSAFPGSGSAIYVGTLSKVLYPALRLGYLVLPPDMVEMVIAARSLTDRQTPTVDQRTLAAFIEQGQFERHLARMRRLYADRRTATVEALGRELPGLHSCDTAETAAGLHLLASLHTSLSEADLLCRLHAVGVRVDGASPCYLEPPERPGVMLGYAALAESVIAEGIRRLAAIVRAAAIRSAA